MGSGRTYRYSVIVIALIISTRYKIHVISEEKYTNYSTKMEHKTENFYDRRILAEKKQQMNFTRQ